MGSLLVAFFTPAAQDAATECNNTAVSSMFTTHTRRERTGTSQTTEEGLGFFFETNLFLYRDCRKVLFSTAQLFFKSRRHFLCLKFKEALKCTKQNQAFSILLSRLFLVLSYCYLSSVTH